jgi:hypothetical protein
VLSGLPHLHSSPLGLDLDVKDSGFLKNWAAAGQPVLAVAEVATSTNGALEYRFIRDEIYSPSGNQIEIMMILVTSALGQRNGWSGLDRIRGLVDGYKRRRGWGLQCGVVG